MSEERSLMIQALQQGILPITSQCGADCLFCSHRYNPPRVRTYHIPARSLQEIQEDMDLVKHLKTITIGESITTIVEGEPLCHPQLAEILSVVRNHYKGALIKLTTNGVLLNTTWVERLHSLAPIELTISLNSVSPKGRDLLGLPQAPELVPLLPSLSEHFPWHGSVVAMPHIVGREEFAHTLETLCVANARTVRVFYPGLTGLAPKELELTLESRQWVMSYVHDIQKRFNTPIILEPTTLDNLAAVVEGSIEGSAARISGINGGEVILVVNGEVPRSRVHAFNLVEAQANPVVKYRRGLFEHSTTLQKERGHKSGLVMHYDLSPLEIDELLQAVEEAALINKRVLVMTSALGYGVIAEVLRHTSAKVEKVESRFFGGNIAAAGLLTVEDFAHVLDRHRRVEGWLVVLPHKAFDMRGRDLTGRSYLSLQDYGCRVVLV